jgi:hypothetical protein
MFALDYGWPHIKHYVVSLMLVYPFMLAAPFVAVRTRSVENVTAIIFVISFYIFYYFCGSFPGSEMNLVFATRFLFPVIPLLILSYAECLENFFKHLPNLAGRLIPVFVSILLAVSTIVIQHKHQQLLRKQGALKEAIYFSTEEGSTLIYDLNSAELIQKVWGDRRYISYPGTEALLNILKAADFSKKVYWVSRNVFYDGELLTGTDPEDFIEIGEHYTLKPVFEHEGFKIVKIVS